MNMSFEDFQAAKKPKVDGSWNLHSLLPTGMDFFILLSSLSGIIGQAGQANYACGNTYQDALVQHRIALKEKAISLDLGNIESVGYTAEREGVVESLGQYGYSTATEAEFLALLDYYCNPGLPLTSPIQSQVIFGLQAPSTPQTQPMNKNSFFNRPICRILRQTGTQDSSTALSESDSTGDFMSLIRAAETLEEAADIIGDGILAKLSKTLAIEKENVDPSMTIATYGVDSLSAVEMRTWFRNTIGADVNTFEILGNESITALSLTIAAKSRFVKASLKEG